MGIKTIGAILAIGAASYMYYPEIKSKVGPYIPRTINEIRRFVFLEDAVTKNEQKPQVSSVNQTQTSPLVRPDGTRMESWNYRGNEWPEGWRVINEDGSYDRDYIRWYEGKHR